MTLVLRDIRPDEGPALEDLQRRASLALGDHVAELTADPSLVALPPEHLAQGFVAEHAGRVAGFAVLLREGLDEAELDGLFVEPEVWRRGVGRALAAEAERRARAAGARRIRVTANVRAVAFYQACGYRVVGETMTRFAPAPVMTLDLVV